MNPLLLLILSFFISISSSLLANTKAPDDLLVAITQGETAKVKTLIGKQNPNSVQIGITNKSYPLIVASEKGQVEIAKLLISLGADVNLHDPQGAYPLYYAITQENIELVKVLLSHKAATDPTASSDRDRPALYWAIENDSTEIVKLLLAHGANPSAAVDGMKLLEFAEEEASKEVVDLLKKAGAK